MSMPVSAVLSMAALPIVACSAAPPEAVADPCATVKQRHSAYRERLVEALREAQARDKADVIAGKSELERNVKAMQLMGEVEREEARYRIGMQECGSPLPSNSAPGVSG